MDGSCPSSGKCQTQFRIGHEFSDAVRKSGITIARYEHKEQIVVIGLEIVIRNRKKREACFFYKNPRTEGYLDRNDCRRLQKKWAMRIRIYEMDFLVEITNPQEHAE